MTSAGGTLPGRGAVQLAATYFEALKETRGRRALVAVAITLLAFWLQILLPVNGTDDDWAMSILLSNSYPDSGYTLFIHPWLSAFVSFLFDVLPWGPNYFILLEMGLSIAAISFILYYSLGHLNMGGALGVMVIALVFAVPHCTTAINFTVVTSVLACAGLAVLLLQLAHGRCTPAASAVGVLFIGVACLFRFKAVVLLVPACLVLVAVVFVRTRGMAVRERALLFVPLAAAVVLCGFLTVASSVIMEQPELKAWQDITQPRSDLGDYYPIRPYDEIAGELAELGVSENDYWMIRQWVANDTGYFTLERLTAVADIACVHPMYSAKFILESCGKYLMRLGARPYMTLTVIAAFLMLFGAWRRSRRLEKLACVAVVLITLAALMYLEITGRVLLRVEYPLWMIAVIVVGALVVLPPQVGAGESPDAGEEPVAVERSAALPDLGSFAAGAVLSLVLVLATYLGAVERPDETAALALLGKSHEDESQLFQYQKEHSDCIFAYDMSVIMDKEQLYDKRCLPSRELTRTTQSLGGWEYGAPFHQKALSEVTGEDWGLFESMAKSDKVFMVTVDDARVGHMLKYIREHYNPTAEAQVVATIRDDELEDTINIIRFATP